MCRHKHTQTLIQCFVCFVLQGEPGISGPQGLKGEKGERVRVILKLILNCSTLFLDLAFYLFSHLQQKRQLVFTNYYRGNLYLLVEVYRAVKESQESQGSL